jgi:hypothetical protein
MIILSIITASHNIDKRLDKKIAAKINGSNVKQDDDNNHHMVSLWSNRFIIAAIVNEAAVTWLTLSIADTVN